MNNQIIKGSDKWIDTVPDEYAIECDEQISSSKEGEIILKFKYVQNRNRLLYGSGFIQKYGIARIPVDKKEILIVKTDLSSFPDVYYRENGEIFLGGFIENFESSGSTNAPPKFSEIIHFSARKFEKQKSDADAPEWLKAFAEKQGASVAYFKF